MIGPYRTKMQAHIFLERLLRFLVKEAMLLTQTSVCLEDHKNVLL